MVIKAVVLKPSAANPPSSRKGFSSLYVLYVPLSYRNYYTTFHRLCPHKLPQPGNSSQPGRPTNKPIHKLVKEGFGFPSYKGNSKLKIQN
jgi:hypothetical protein